MTIRIAHLIPGFTGLLLVMGSTIAADTGDVKNGKLVYERYCMSCHGDQGNGQGEAAEYMSIKPRDYRQGTYKWRSTPSGSLPLDSDLEHTLFNGLYGTYMPTWKVLDERSRRDVIAYIKTFSPRFATEKPQPAIEIPPDPGYSDASGAGGQGDGPSAHELKDDWGNQLVPYDLTKGHVKCGDQSTDIYRVFMAGLSGTPMPTFSDSLSSADAWDLVHFIQSLSPGYATNAAGTAANNAPGDKK